MATARSIGCTTLYYFSTDISNDGLKHSGFLAFCKTQGVGNSFVKSASYLMHETYFSLIRDFLAAKTDTLIQDDSGIPCSFFAPEKWNMTFYGNYPGPITLFKNYHQPLLADYYKTTNPKPLDLGIGYRHHAKESTLMVFSRKSVTNIEPKLEARHSKTPLRALQDEAEESADSTMRLLVLGHFKIRRRNSASEKGASTPCLTITRSSEGITNRR